MVPEIPAARAKKHPGLPGVFEALATRKSFDFLFGQRRDFAKLSFQNRVAQTEDSGLFCKLRDFVFAFRGQLRGLDFLIQGGAFFE